MTKELDTTTALNGKTQRASKLTIAMSFAITLLNIIIAPAVMGSGFDSQRWGEFVGTLIGPVVFGLLVVVSFQLFKKFRNHRSRWKIYCWTVAVLFISNFARLAQTIVPSSNL
jgi:hypothetical protein